MTYNTSNKLRMIYGLFSNMAKMLHFACIIRDFLEFSIRVR